MVYLSEEEGKRKTIERVLHATGCSFGFDTYKFPFSEKGGRTMGDISFPALKIENGDNTVYLIDYEMDSDIYGLLYGKWEVKLLNY
ncbi:MAG: hypothetical protein E4H39_01820 [Syntrophobacterales bacterium]|nr:MAG: hypothetical protein E4H39_01820 [Syntrophobacterales bacterium]